MLEVPLPSRDRVLDVSDGPGEVIEPLPPGDVYAVIEYIREGDDVRDALGAAGVPPSLFLEWWCGRPWRPDRPLEHWVVATDPLIVRDQAHDSDEVRWILAPVGGGPPRPIEVRWSQTQSAVLGGDIREPSLQAVRAVLALEEPPPVLAGG